MKKPLAVPLYAVRVMDGRRIVAIREVDTRLRVGEGANVMAADERRVASHCIARLGDGDPYTWRDPDSAAYVARCDPSARVEPLLTMAPVASAVTLTPVTATVAASGMCCAPGCENDAGPTGVCAACAASEEDPLS